MICWPVGVSCMKDFFKYLKSFFFSMKNYFTGLSFAFFLGSFFVPKMVPWREQFQIAALIVAFFFAGYFAWKRDRKPPEDDSELRVSMSKPALQPVSFHGGGRLGRLHLFLDADIANPRSTVCIVERPKLQSYNLGTDLFLRSKGKMKITEKSNPIYNSPFPMKLGPSDRILLHIRIEIETETDDPKVIAKTLSSLSEYSFELDVFYSFNAERKEVIRCSATGDYDGLRQSVLKHWEDNKLHELLCIANGTIV